MGWLLHHPGRTEGLSPCLNSGAEDVTRTRDPAIFSRIWWLLPASRSIPRRLICAWGSILFVPGRSDITTSSQLFTVQKLAGHSSVQTTSWYDRQGEAARRKAADLLHLSIEQ
jgi:hypothetical protein